MPEQVIAFTVSGLRESYLRESLRSWGKVRGVQDWHLVFCLEPCRQVFPVAEFTQWVNRCFASAEVIVNDDRLGCLRNTRRAMRAAFACGAQFAVLAEEDVKVSDDVLEYFAWARDAYAADSQVAAVCAHAKSTETGGEHQVVRTAWFNPVIWGTWADRWGSFIDPGWGYCEGNTESWDHHLRLRIAEAGKASLYPVRSRAFHIGQVSTLTPGTLAEWFYQVSVSSSFAAHREPGQYEEIPHSRKLGLLV